jgi:hypothetical protein
MGEVVQFVKRKRKRCAHSFGGNCIAPAKCLCDRGISTKPILPRLNPHSPMNVPPLLRPGRDAGSIADLIAFAKTGAPPEV